MIHYKKFVPFLNRVVVEKMQMVAQSPGGILLPQKQMSENYAMVVSVGPGKMEDGQVVPVEYKPGQYVLLPDFGGQKFKLADDKEYYIYREDDILGVLEQ